MQNYVHVVIVLNDPLDEYSLFSIISGLSLIIKSLIIEIVGYV